MPTMDNFVKQNQMHWRISGEERNRRMASIAYARGSVRFEGFILSPAIEKINERFINGELTRQEHIDAIKIAVLHE